MIKKTVIEQIEIQPETGHVSVRLHKRLMDGDTVVASGNHRAMLEPDTDIGACADAVNNHLLRMGEAPVAASEWEQVKKYAALARTPAILKVWKKQKEARLAQEKIDAKMREEGAAEAQAQEQARIDAAVKAALKKGG